MIGVNLLLLSVVIAANVAEPGPLAVMSGILVGPLCTYVALQQYLGTFRGVRSAATKSSVLLYLFAGFLLFVVITETGAALAAGLSSLRLMASFLISMLATAGLGLMVGRMNALWSRTLRASMAAATTYSAPIDYSLLEVLLAKVKH